MEKDFRIEAVTCRVLRPALSHQFHWLLDDPMATPVAHVPGMRDRRQLAPDLFGNILVEISLGNGSVGFALGVGGEPTRHVINQLAPLLRGKDGRNIAEHWHWMNRLCGFRTGLGGPSTLGISAIDLALWDLAGKLVGLPVAKLLGGKCPASLKITLPGLMPRQRARWAFRLQS